MFLKVGRADESLTIETKQLSPVLSLISYLQCNVLLSKSLAQTNIFYGLLNLCYSVIFPGGDSSFELLTKIQLL